jgi:hypothetical protein
LETFAVFFALDGDLHTASTAQRGAIVLDGSLGGSTDQVVVEQELKANIRGNRAG